MYDGNCLGETQNYETRSFPTCHLLAMKREILMQNISKKFLFCFAKSSLKSSDICHPEAEAESHHKIYMQHFPTRIAFLFFTVWQRQEMHHNSCCKREIIGSIFGLHASKRKKTFLDLLNKQSEWNGKCTLSIAQVFGLNSINSWLANIRFIHHRFECVHRGIEILLQQDRREKFERISKLSHGILD